MTNQELICGGLKLVFGVPVKQKPFIRNGIKYFIVNISEDSDQVSIWSKEYHHETITIDELNKFF